MKNMERSVLDEIGTFSCENEEQIAKPTGLENGLLDKVNKVKEIDQKILDILFYHRRSRNKSERTF